MKVKLIITCASDGGGPDATTEGQQVPSSSWRWRHPIEKKILSMKKINTLCLSRPLPTCKSSTTLQPDVGSVFIRFSFGSHAPLPYLSRIVSVCFSLSLFRTFRTRHILYSRYMWTSSLSFAVLSIRTPATAPDVIHQLSTSALSTPPIP